MNIQDSQALIRRLAERLDLHRIFLFSYPFLEEERQHLLLVINPVKGLSPKTMAPLVSLCMSDIEEVPFDMILTGEWQNQLKQGSLYYTYASLPQHEVFSSSKKKSFLLSNKTITAMLELGQLNYEKCRKSSDEFKGAVNNFLVKGDYGQTTFMLHQYLEVRLKGFQATAGINGGKSHNIEHLMKSVRSVAPPLLTIFSYDTPAVELFRLLDEAYIKGKKMEALSINEEEFQFLMEKCEEACRVLDGMISVMVSQISVYLEQQGKEISAREEAKESPQGAVPTNDLKATSTQQVIEDFSGFPWPEQYKKDVNALLDDIYKNHRPEQIMMLNYHTGGFSGANLFQGEKAGTEKGSKVELYLVVLMKNRGPFRFKCKEAGLASAMVLYLNVEYVKKILTEGDRFVHTLWTKGWVLRRKSGFVPSFTVADMDWTKEYERVKEIWTNAKVSMNNLKEVIVQTVDMKFDTGLLLLKDLLEIGVYTFLQCAVGDIPKQLHLSELIDWSCVIDRKLLEFVYPKSEKEKAHLHLILNPTRIWWENTTMSFSKVSQSFCRDYAKDIFRFFERIMQELIGELESKVCPLEGTNQ